MPEHKTARHQDFGDGDVAFRMDREYYWDCSCGHRSENDGSRTKMDRDRLAHEAEANRSDVEVPTEQAGLVYAVAVSNYEPAEVIELYDNKAAAEEHADSGENLTVVTWQPRSSYHPAAADA